MRAIQHLAIFLLGSSFALCGGAADAFRGVDVTGQGYGGGFRLAGHDGKPRTTADFAGKVVVVTFGFTRCPDVCPISLAALAATMDALGEDHERVQVLFITVDPERDTPGLLAEYVTAFEPTFLGLAGDPTATREAARAFKVFYQKVPMGKGGYTMDHSTGYYAIDKQGRTRLMFRYGQPVADMAYDIRLLLRETRGAQSTTR
ncbi:MAG: SCO family protein [Burkholderiales bacterium]